MPTVIGFFGVARAGKSTAARLAADTLIRSGKNAVVRSFAGPIRDGLAEMGILKDTYPTLYRKAAQLIGTELCRDEDPDWWINQMNAAVSKLPEDTIVLIDDCRFDNEFEYIKSMNGQRVFVAAGDRVDLSSPMYKHSSETIAVTYEKFWRAYDNGLTSVALQDQDLGVDYILPNTGDLNKLVSNIDNMFSLLKRI